MLSLNKCPGLDKFRNPEITEKTCPVCGEIIELFSVDTSVACDKCGFVAYNDTKSCVSWCKYAKECFGEDLYDRLVTDKQKEINNN